MSAILLVDISSVAHAAFYVSGSEPDPDWTARETVERVRKLANDYPHTAICIDRPPYFRKAIDPEYKAQRPKEHGAVIAHQIATALDVLKADGFPVWGQEGYEADDIIASAVRAATQWYTGKGHDQEFGTAVIASSDKDLLQLVSDRVSVKSLKDGSLLGPDEVKAKFGVWPHQMGDYLALVGDASDNIKGAKLIGPVGAQEILGLFGQLDKAIAAAKSGEFHGPLTPCRIKSLLEFEPRMHIVRDLIRLRTDAVLDFSAVFTPRAPVAVFGGEEMNDYEQNSEVASQDSEMVSVGVQAADATSAQASIDAGAGHAGRAPDAGRVVGAAGEGHQALAVRQGEVMPAPVEWNLGLEPRSLQELKGLAETLFASRHLSAYGSAPGVFTTILAGRELGMPAMVALRAFHIIEGKPAMAADAIRARVLGSPLCEYFRCTERTPERATFVGKRKGDPEVSLTYTVEEGRAAFSGDEKKFSGSGWGKNPADMCVARASSKLARLLWPDVVHGFYAVEEF